MRISQHRHSLRLWAVVAFILAWSAPGIAPAENWPRFRGPNGTGISDEKGFPTTWNAGDEAWTIELPGVGHSSPIIWNDHLIVTSAIDEGTLRYLICLDAYTGRLKWSRSLGYNKSSKHQKNSFASSTPATDGERIYVAFADADEFTLSAYDFDGELEWRRCLGPFVSQHGHAASPIVFGNMVIVTNDQQGPSSIVAFERHTGNVVWSVLRSIRRTSYATPMILSDRNAAPQLICVSGAMGMTSHNPYTGEQNWTTGEMPLRTVASPVYGNGLLFATCGEGGAGKLLIAVDPYAADDSFRTRIKLSNSLTVDEPHHSDPNGGGAGAPDRVKYTRTRTLPYVPSPIAYGDHLFLWNDNGIVCCMDMATGTNLWTKRVGGQFSGSPVCIDGKLYSIDESGQVVVIAAESVFKHYGTTPLGDPSHATPAVANGRLYLRTFHKLVCLEAIHD